MRHIVRQELESDSA